MCERSASTGTLVLGIENQLTRTRLDNHNMHISDNQYLEKFFKNLRQKLNLSEGAQVLNEKTNVLTWELFMSTTMKASVHLGPSYNEHFVAYRNTNFDELMTLFDITQRLILEHALKILNVSTAEWLFTPRMRSTLLHDKAIKWTRTKVHVYSDSVLGLG